MSNPRTNSLNDTCRLVTKNRRTRRRDRPFKSMKIAVTNTTCNCFYLNLIGSWLSNLDVFNCERFVFFSIYRGFDFHFFPFNAGPSPTAQ